MRDEQKGCPNRLAASRRLLSQDPASERGGRIDLVRLQSLDGVEVMNVQDVSRQWIYFHETYSFCVVSRVTSPQGIPWRYRGRVHSMNGEGVQLMEPGELHANSIEAPRADFRVLFVAPDKMGEIARQLGWERATPLHLKVAQLGNGAVRAVLRQLVGAIVDDGDVERSELGVYRLLETLSQRGCFETAIPTRRMPHCKGERAAWQARDMIHAHWNQHLPVDVVSTQVGIPVSTLERAFKLAYGTSPRQYQTHVRLMRAKEMIKNARASVARAASETGFRDPNYFSRLFRREFGCGPQEYRMAVASEKGLNKPEQRSSITTL